MEKAEAISGYSTWLDEFIPHIHANGFTEEMNQRDVAWGKALGEAGVKIPEMMSICEAAIERHGGEAKFKESIFCKR